MKNTTCSGCVFSLESDPNPADLRAPRNLLCRRLPPTVLALGMSQQGLATSSQFPTVKPDGWCGEWQPADDTVTGINAGGSA